MYKILLIDDEPKDMKNSFLSVGWELVEAINEEEATKQLSLHQFDVIILDLALRGTSSFDRGFIFLKELNVAIKFSIPIIVLTKDMNEGSMQRALNQGAAGFYQKGVYNPRWIQEQIIEIITAFSKGTPPIDPFFSHKKSLIYQRQQLLKKLKQNNIKIIFSIEGKVGVGKQFLVKYLRNNGINIELHDFEITSTFDIRNFDSVINVIAINNISRTSLETQREIFNNIRDFNVSFIFLLDETFYDYYDKGLILDELFDLVMKNTRMSLPVLKERTEDISDLINTFLAEPSICPKHLPYFAKTSDQVFTEDVLNLFYTYDWKTNIRELRHFIQYTMCQVIIRKHREKNYPEIIGQDLLPIRLKPIEVEIRLEEPDHRLKEAHEFLHKINIAMNQNENNFESAAEALNKDVSIIKKQLKHYFDLVPSAFDKDRYASIFGFLEFNIFFCYAPESEDIYNELKKHLSSLSKHPLCKVTHNQKPFLGSNLVNQLKTQLSQSKIICFIICKDLFSSESSKCRVPLEYIPRKKENQDVVPIIGKSYAWEELPEFKDLEALPRNGQPIMHNNSFSDEILTQVAKEIKALFNERLFR
ncbi:response regulator [Haliscomenobacter hydrossis]|uniref:Two component, sigma54 specific, transcriptional regulator n=1 Tax=Haliscomenobacter hydrossis (strain ATCC 27775 / DSM 1100 / LMG 10767 / O) TaxID=760192 RepID=F4L617_HALH1|nr:response regulator [Haliscomenobacter hydrossis]AEE53077.1 putative two component, sigma54 specific, transcriptional regulator [Haliscomenobacter hydrossis DSM 1100]